MCRFLHGTPVSVLFIVSTSMLIDTQYDTLLLLFGIREFENDSLPWLEFNIIPGLEISREVDPIFRGGRDRHFFRYHKVSAEESLLSSLVSKVHCY